MKTNQTAVTGYVAVWAIPNRYAGPDDPPFHHELRTTSAWETGAVKLHEVEITVELPEGIDVIRMAIQTLTEAKKEIMGEYHKKLVDLDARIAELLRITHQPAEPGMDGSVLEGSADEVLDVPAG